MVWNFRVLTDFRRLLSRNRETEWKHCTRSCTDRDRDREGHRHGQRDRRTDRETDRQRQTELHRQDCKGKMPVKNKVLSSYVTSVKEPLLWCRKKRDPLVILFEKSNYLTRNSTRYAMTPPNPVSRRCKRALKLCQGGHELSHMTTCVKDPTRSCVWKESCVRKVTSEVMCVKEPRNVRKRAPKSALCRGGHVRKRALSCSFTRKCGLFFLKFPTNVALLFVSEVQMELFKTKEPHLNFHKKGQMGLFCLCRTLVKGSHRFRE